MKTSLLTTLLQGLAIGTAEITPGISGSTMALLLGIYDDFIDLLFQVSELGKIIGLMVLGKTTQKAVVKQFKKVRWTFGITLGVGMLMAIGLLSSVIGILLTQYFSWLMAVLLGLTLPTIWIVYQQMHKPGLKELVITSITTATLTALFVFSNQSVVVTNPHPLYLFAGGMIAVSALVLPGISGSFMLLILGLYNYIIGLVIAATHGEIDVTVFSNLLILVAGMGVGFLTTVRLLKKAFVSVRNELMSFLLGLLLASWYVLWPLVEITGYDHTTPITVKRWITQMPPYYTLMIFSVTALTALGTWALHHWADTRDTKSPKQDEGFDRL